MMKFRLFIVLMLLVHFATAQENLDFNSQKPIVSPEIHADYSVTFRLLAPRALEVKLVGDFGGQKEVAMQKTSDGLWTYTSSPLPSNLYSYTFKVDGLVMHDPNNVYLLRDVASVVNIFLIGNGKADDYKVNDVPHGTVLKQWYHSKGLNAARRLTVYTPPGYESTTESYPVLYLLHGVGGDEEAWMQLGRASQIMDNLIANKKAKPMMVVMTNGHTSNSAAPGESSKGFYKPIMMTPDVFNGDMERNFKEVIDFIEHHYRVKKNKENRAIAGLSMGGFHTLYISANYPNTFSYMGLFSPAILPPKEKQIELYQHLDEKLKLQQKNGYRLYWIGIGKNDFLFKPVNTYREKLDAMHFKYTYHESDGGHTWTNWRDYLVDFVPMLFK